jgi:6-phosphogluconolactonase
MHARPVTRRSFLAQLSLLPLAAKCAVSSTLRSGLVFAGTTTRGRSTSRGIYAYRWDQASGTPAALGLAAETESPTFLALSLNRKYIYAANEISDYHGTRDGSVSAFSLDPASGRLTLRNTVSSGGASPCHVAVDHSGNALFVADSAGGSLASYRILPDGGLSDPVSNLHFTGHSINPKRQKSAYIRTATQSHRTTATLSSMISVWIASQPSISTLAVPSSRLPNLSSTRRYRDQDLEGSPSIPMAAGHIPSTRC